MTNLLKKSSGFVIVSFYLMLVSASSAFATAYHISPHGSDANDCSAEYPCQSTDRTNQLQLNRGDIVSFEGGHTYAGRLIVNRDNYNSSSSDDASARLTITSSGTSRATLGGIVIHDSRLIEINEINLYGGDPQITSGLSMINVDHTLVRNITIENFLENGVEFQATDQDANYKLHIKDVKVLNNGGGGMLFSGTNGTDCPAEPRIKGLKIENVEAVGNKYGIGASGVKRLTITESKAVENSGYGIAADCVEDFSIKKNDEIAYSLDVNGEGGSGIKVTRSQRGEITQNKVYGNTVNVKLEDTAETLIAHNQILYSEKSSLWLPGGNAGIGIVQNTVVASGEGPDSGAAIDVTPTNPLTVWLGNNVIVTQGDADAVKVDRGSLNAHVVFLRNNYFGNGKFLDQGQTFDTLAAWMAAGVENDPAFPGLAMDPGFDQNYKPSPDFLAQRGIDYTQFGEEFESLRERYPRDIDNNLIGNDPFAIGAHKFVAGTPPPPPPGDAIATLTATQGWATFGQVVPEGMARDGLKLGDLVTQTDVKTRWPDGSIRFAVVTARIPSDGTYNLTAGPASTGTFTPNFPSNLRVVFGGLMNWWDTTEGVTYTARFTPSQDSWLDGPLVQERRKVVAPVDGSGRFHPFLRVLFDTRTYNDGETRADVTVENVLDMAEATGVWYEVEIKNGNQVLYANRNVSHPYLTRWRKVFALTGLTPLSEITPDFEPAYRAKALPRFLPIVANLVSGVPQHPDYDILGVASLNPNMYDHGGRDEIAPYPNWAVRYLVHKNPTQREFVLLHGDLAGSWPVHVRKVDGQVPTIDEEPYSGYWFDARGSWPFGNLNATGRLIPDIAHQPSLAYIPYLITGDRYYADETAFWPNYCLFATWQDGFYNARGGSMGFLDPNETRGIAWAVRNIADAAAYLPASDAGLGPLREYFRQKLLNNFARWDAFAQNPAYMHPQGIAIRTPDVDPFLGVRAFSMWQENMRNWAVYHANQQGIVGGMIGPTQFVRLQVACARNSEIWENCAPYRWPTHYQNDTPIPNVYEVARFVGRSQYPGYYGPDLLDGAVGIALHLRLPGAQEAFDHLFPLLAVDPYMFDVSDLALRAGWAIDWAAEQSSSTA